MTRMYVRRAWASLLRRKVGLPDCPTEDHLSLIIEDVVIPPDVHQLVDRLLVLPWYRDGRRAENYFLPPAK